MDQSRVRRDDCKRFCRLPEALWRELDLGAVILNEKTGSAFTLNPGALLLWRALDGKRTVKELTEQAIRGAGVVDELDDAITKTLEQFLQAGLIGECPDGSGKVSAEPSDITLSFRQPPEITEIEFGVCDCTAAPMGVTRNQQCLVPGHPLSTHTVIV